MPGPLMMNPNIVTAMVLVTMARCTNNGSMPASSPQSVWSDGKSDKQREAEARAAKLDARQRGFRNSQSKSSPHTRPWGNRQNRNNDRVCVADMYRPGGPYGPSVHSVKASLDNSVNVSLDDSVKAEGGSEPVSVKSASVSKPMVYPPLTRLGDADASKVFLPYQGESGPIDFAQLHRVSYVGDSLDGVPPEKLLSKADLIIMTDIHNVPLYSDSFFQLARSLHSRDVPVSLYLEGRPEGYKGVVIKTSIQLKGADLPESELQKAATLFQELVNGFEDGKAELPENKAKLQDALQLGMARDSQFERIIKAHDAKGIPMLFVGEFHIENQGEGNFLSRFGDKKVVIISSRHFGQFRTVDDYVNSLVFTKKQTSLFQSGDYFGMLDYAESYLKQHPAQLPIINAFRAVAYSLSGQVLKGLEAFRLDYEWHPYSDSHRMSYVNSLVRHMQVSVDDPSLTDADRKIKLKELISELKRVPDYRKYIPFQSGSIDWLNQLLKKPMGRGFVPL